MSQYIRRWPDTPSWKNWYQNISTLVRLPTEDMIQFHQLTVTNPMSWLIIWTSVQLKDEYGLMYPVIHEDEVTLFI